jgi:predicted DNA-binding transcriptional regulator AlpA
VTTKETPADLLSKFESSLSEVEPAEVPGLIVRLAAAQAALAARMAQHNGHAVAALSGPDELLKVGEAARRLGVSTDWLYHRAHELPFAKKLGPRQLRFSSKGIERYLKTRVLAAVLRDGGAGKLVS